MLGAPSHFPTEYRYEAAVVSWEHRMKWVVISGDCYQWPLPWECIVLPFDSLCFVHFLLPNLVTLCIFLLLLFIPFSLVCLKSCCSLSPATKIDEERVANLFTPACSLFHPMKWFRPMHWQPNKKHIWHKPLNLTGVPNEQVLCGRPFYSFHRGSCACLTVNLYT